MAIKRSNLKDTHPTVVKLNQLYALADELGIQLEFLGQGGCKVYDRDAPEGHEFFMMDISDEGPHRSEITSFPHAFETKLVVERWVDEEAQG